MKKLLGPIIPLVLIIQLSSSGKNMTEIAKWFPDRIDGWSAIGGVAAYNRETLFNHINGGAEPYLTYSFQEAHVRRYSGPSGSEIVLEVYDMGNPGDAFGIFSIERADEEIGIGEGSEYGGGLLRFWKGRYFVSIITTGKEDEAKPAMLKLARTVEAKMEGSSQKPELLVMVPRTGLTPVKIRSFHTFTILNRLYYLAEENILNLDMKTQCVLATYPAGKGEAQLLLVKYKDAQAARNALDLFRKSYIPEGGASGIHKTENGKWTLSKAHSWYIAIVFDAPDRKWGETLLRQANLKEE